MPEQILIKEGSALLPARLAADRKALELAMS
jgi:hypothetical protein